MGYVPLTHWTEQWKATPRECVAAAKSSADFGGVILAAWIASAAHHADAAWITALVLEAADGDGNLPLHLLSRLEPVPQLELLAVLLKKHSNLDGLAGLLEATTVELDTDSAKSAIEIAERHVSSMGQGYDAALSGVLDKLALRLPPALADVLSQTWGVVNWPYNDKPRERFLHLLSLRRDIHRGFTR